MCMASAPVAPPESDATKPVPYLANPWLDGTSINGIGSMTGRNSLRIDPGSTNGVWTPLPTVAPPGSIGIGAGTGGGTGTSSGSGAGGGGGGASGNIGGGRFGTGIKVN